MAIKSATSTASTDSTSGGANPRHEIALRNPATAALLAWLIPGLGHIYQGRTAKGVMFSVCILTIFIYGLVLGQGRVVYAAWGPQENRWHFLSQVGVGLPAAPAVIQWQRVRTGKIPLFGNSRFMAPPAYSADGLNELHLLHKNLNRYFELGSVYTMIAGLLNMLVIYDAWAGPAFALRRKQPDADSEQDAPSAGKGS